MDNTSKKSSKQVRIGVVGGGFGCSFYWHEHPNCKVMAVSDKNPELLNNLCKTYQCGNTYSSFEEMIQDKNVDAVAIFSGAPDHVKHSCMAMRAGKHVISAVPAAQTLEDAQRLADCVKETGMTYMMAETSYYRQPMISARKFLKEGKFGNIYYTEAEYHHGGSKGHWFLPDGSSHWRHGNPPMLYPTHCTSFLVGLTGERLTSVSCIGWGDDDPILKGNPYNNPFWCETALFKTDRANSMRVSINWKGAFGICERAQWYGDRMSFFMTNPNDPNCKGPSIAKMKDPTEEDAPGFCRQISDILEYNQPNWWETDLLPETMRHGGGHDGGEVFLTHEFISALIEDRKPAIDVKMSLAFTVPGIVAHQSALQGGKLLEIPSFA